MTASRLHSTPGTDDMLSAEGIQLDIVVPNGSRADAHTLRMAAASDTQAANIAGEFATLPRALGSKEAALGAGRAAEARAIATADLERNAGGARELTRRIDAELSRRIALAPHAWPWMHPRWSNVTMD